MVNAWLWQRIAPMRTHKPSIIIGLASRPIILLVSAPPFHSSLLWPLPKSLSIQGIKLPASGTPNCEVGNFSSRKVAATVRSISKIAEAGSSNK